MLKVKKRFFKMPAGFVVLVCCFGILFFGRMEKNVVSIAEKTLIPGVLCSAISYNEESHWIEKQISMFFPFYKYCEIKSEKEVFSEDETTYQMILAMQAYDEDIKAEEEREETKEETAKEVSVEKLKNFEYLLGHFYTVDSTTYVDETLLNASEMLKKDMTMKGKEKGPKVLIFHTHSQEEFKDSKKGDSSTTIVGMGKFLSEKLNDKGIEAIHHAGVYDLIDGKLDRSKAYQLAEENIKKILKENPTIEVVIDLHRDGVPEKKHLVTEIDGKKTAKIMFFNGLSRTKANGEISYLKNPYIKDNLAFSFQMQLAAKKMYPGLTRNIYLKGYRYSLHMKPKSLLIEAGAQNNSVAEIKNAMECLSNVLCEVLQKTD